MHCKHEEYHRWRWPLLAVAFRRCGPKGDNEELEILITSDRQDDQAITVVGTCEIEQFAHALRELANKLN